MRASQKRDKHKKKYFFCYKRQNVLSDTGCFSCGTAKYGRLKRLYTLQVTVVCALQTAHVCFVWWNWVTLFYTEPLKLYMVSHRNILGTSLQSRLIRDTNSGQATVRNFNTPTRNLLQPKAIARLCGQHQDSGMPYQPQQEISTTKRL